MVSNQKRKRELKEESDYPTNDYSHSDELDIISDNNQEDEAD